MKLDILVVAAHPDDAELSCSGTLLAQAAKGCKIGIVDLTRGELGTRGTATTRKQEAAAASEIMGLSARENLGLPDGFFENTREHQLPLIRAIRKYQPEIVIANAIRDRHPDHGKGALLAKDACFLSGLRKIETDEEGETQEVWRPAQLFHMIQSEYIKPDFVVDVTDFWEQKVQAIQAYQTQFFSGESTDKSEDAPNTFISTPAFMRFLEARAREFGQAVGVEYAEGFTFSRQVMVNDLRDFAFLHR